MIDQDLLNKNFKEYLQLQGSSLRTQKGYLFDLNHFLNWLSQQNINIDQTTKQTVEAYIKSLTDTKSTATVNRILSTLRVFFQYLTDKKFILNNPVIEISNIKQQQPLKHFSTIISAYEAKLKHEGILSGQAAHQKTVVNDFLTWINNKTPS